MLDVHTFQVYVFYSGMQGVFVVLWIVFSLPGELIDQDLLQTLTKRRKHNGRDDFVIMSKNVLSHFGDAM